MKMKPGTMIFVVIFLIVIFIIPAVNRNPNEDQAYEKFKQEIVEKKAWLISQMEEIDDFIDFKRSNVVTDDRAGVFYSRYASPEYDDNKLIRLYNHLLYRGWIDITNNLDREKYIRKTSSESEKTARYVKILCKDKATLFMYMTDMQDDYIIDEFKVRTLVSVEYNYNLPCYNLEIDSNSND